MAFSQWARGSTHADWITLSLSALFMIPGFYVFELTIHDTQYSTRSLITVAVNSTPQVNLQRNPDLNCYPVGQPIQLRVFASDPGGQIQSVELFEGAHHAGILTAPNSVDQAYEFWLDPAHQWHR